jgi:predicted type IV restriction endonuclease
MLAEAIEHVRSKIARSRGSQLNEQNTKASLIDPILRAVGWDTGDWEEVQREFKAQSGDNPVDYALMDVRTQSPLLFIEAKALGENLEDRKWIGQILTYANVANVRWVVLTNGDEYRLYDAYAQGPVSDKLVRAAQVSRTETNPEIPLELLSKRNVEANEIDAIWRAQVVDQRVRSAVEDLFSPEPDKALIALLRRKLGDVSASEIRAALRRGPYGPYGSGPAAQAAAGGREAADSRGVRLSGVGAQTKAAREQALSAMERAGLISLPIGLEAHYKGRRLNATLQVDGQVEFGGRHYPSLSAAGGAAKASAGTQRPDGKPFATNGWDFWHVRTPDGGSVSLLALRNRITESEAV